MQTRPIVIRILSLGRESLFIILLSVQYIYWNFDIEEFRSNCLLCLDSIEVLLDRM
jgi:hypothetical protein